MGREARQNWEEQREGKPSSERKRHFRLDTAFIPCIQEAETGGSLNSRPVWQHHEKEKK